MAPGNFNAPRRDWTLNISNAPKARKNSAQGGGSETLGLYTKTPGSEGAEEIVQATVAPNYFTDDNPGLDTSSPAYLPQLLQSKPHIKFRS